MTQIRVHTALPSGFAYADDIQRARFAETGSVNGASKVCLVQSPDAEVSVSEETSTLAHVLEHTDLAVRLRPPFKPEHVTWRSLIANNALQLGLSNADVLDWYVREYNNGWQASRRGGDSVAFDRGSTTHAWDDGYLDANADRPKWHLTWCLDHDRCGEA